MSKYYKAEDVINAIEYKIAEYIPTLYGRYAEIPLELRMAIEHLPSIEVSEDCISVEDIGKTLNEWLEDKEMARFATKVLRLEAPRVVPSRAEGEWIDNGNVIEPIWKCSECGEVEIGHNLTNFCPNCGAKMRLE